MEENEKEAEKLTEEVAEDTKPVPEAEPIKKKTCYGSYSGGDCDENPIATKRA